MAIVSKNVPLVFLLIDDLEAVEKWATTRAKQL